MTACATVRPLAPERFRRSVAAASRFPRGVELEYYVVAAVWTAGALVLTLWEREREAREALLEQQIAAREAQVRELAGRLHPHFLFNSLNTIRSFAADDPERAREMLTRLAAFLRHAMAVDPAHPVPLAAEIESARAYLWIEEARFAPELGRAGDDEPPLRARGAPPPRLSARIGAAGVGRARRRGERRHREGQRARRVFQEAYSERYTSRRCAIRTTVTIRSTSSTEYRIR